MAEGAQPKKRRGRGEGGVYQRQSDGLWVGAVELGWQDGKRRRRIVYGQTKDEVKREVRRLTLERERGMPVQSKRRKVADYLEQWLADLPGPVRPKTVRTYTYLTRAYLIPYLGKHSLETLTQHHVRQMMDAMQADGKSARTARHARAVLRTALNDAIREDLIVRNVAALAKPPKEERSERPALTAAEAHRLFAAVKGTRWEALFTMAAVLGIRQSELLGLRWQEVDLDNGVLRLRYQLQAMTPDDPDAGAIRLLPRWGLADLKTKRSRRTFPLPAPIIALLKTHRQEQRKERLMAGGRWRDLDMVFCTTVGTPIDAANLRKVHRQALKDAGLPEELHFHDLRHSASSIMAALGIPPAIVQAILGHANVSTTMDVYTHGTADALADAADKLGVMLNKTSS